MTAAHRVAPRRERARAATIEEIKRTATALMRENGISDVRFTDIARAMEMTPPALYRYFADRDELLSALIVDAYDDLGRCVAAASEAVADGDLAGKWLAVGQAYRRWARREPQQFTLILGLPLPGYAAPEDGPTTEAARRALSQLYALFVEAIDRKVLSPPLMRDVNPSIEACALIKNNDLHVSVSAETFQAMLHAWSAVHGFAALEAYGHYDWMGDEARDALFVNQIRLTALAAGLPVPDAP